MFQFQTRLDRRGFVQLPARIGRYLAEVAHAGPPTLVIKLTRLPTPEGWRGQAHFRPGAAAWLFEGSEAVSAPITFVGEDERECYGRLSEVPPPVWTDWAALDWSLRNCDLARLYNLNPSRVGRMRKIWSE